MVDRRNLFLAAPAMRVNAVNELSSLNPNLHRAARHVARGLSRRDALVLSGAAAAGLAIATAPARAVTVDITQGNVQPMPIAIPDFLGGTPADNETAHGVTQIITNNLKRSGLFAPLDFVLRNFNQFPNRGGGRVASYPSAQSSLSPWPMRLRATGCGWSPS